MGMVRSPMTHHAVLSYRCIIYLKHYEQKVEAPSYNGIYAVSGDIVILLIFRKHKCFFCYTQFGASPMVKTKRRESVMSYAKRMNTDLSTIYYYNIMIYQFIKELFTQ